MGLISWVRRRLGIKSPLQRRIELQELITRAWEVTDPASRDVLITYAPQRLNGIPDTGEIVWAWVPYAEDPEQGKDRPMLVIARHDALRVYALKLTTKARPGAQNLMLLGPGTWDNHKRDSWIEMDKLYSIHHQGIRREASPLDRNRFTYIAQALADRHGWRVQI